MRAKILTFMLPSALCLSPAAYARTLGVGFPQSRNAGRPAVTEPALARRTRKLPVGVRGFEPYAPRAVAEYKVATGGGTRGYDEFEHTLSRGHDLYEQGKYREAAEYYERAAKMKPLSFRAFFVLGVAREAAGQFAEAVAAYRTALTLKAEPSDDLVDPLQALYGFANSQAAVGQHAEAVAAYRRLIDEVEKARVPHSKPHAQLRYNLALSLDAVGRRGEAIEAFKQAARIEPDYAEAWYNLGVAHGRAEQYGAAAEAFKQAIAANPQYASAHYNLGLARWLSGDTLGMTAQLSILRALDSPLARELAKLIGK